MALEKQKSCNDLGYTNLLNTHKSKLLYEKAKEILPGGVSSPVRAIKPYPFYTKSAKGSKLIDVDGNEYIDYCMSYGPILLGHENQSIKNAIQNQLEKGWAYGTPTELEIKLANEIVNIYPSIEMLRFVSTGTEATMGAIRVARGFTGNDKIIKIEGGFHGAHDAVLVKAGSGATTLGIPDSLGIPKSATENTLQIPFNDIESLINIIKLHKGEIAALIMEPIMGNIGPILPKKDYLKEVRKITKEENIVLIFDEVITGFRVSLSGAQGYYNIKPDLTTLGKVLGGGLPIGVIGGKKEILEKMAPNGPIYQAGTFNGNPISMAAGLSVIENLKQKYIYENLNLNGDKLRIALSDIIEDKNKNYSVSGIGSMFKVFFGDKPSNYTEALKCNKKKYFDFFHQMLNSGIFLPPSQFETCFLSLSHDDYDLEKTIDAYKENL